MRAQRNEVDAKLFDIETKDAGRLHRIAMKERALRVRDLRDLGNRMQDTDFVVRRHRADEQRVASDRVTQPVEIDPPLAIDLEIA